MGASFSSLADLQHEIVQKDDMIFPIEASKEAFSYVHAVYAAQGAADRCRQFVGHEGHRYYKEPVWPFMKQYLSR